jgi:hypothetical protein
MKVVGQCMWLTGSVVAAAVALKPDVFEGLRFELTRPLNQNFFLTHR